MRASVRGARREMVAVLLKRVDDGAACLPAEFEGQGCTAAKLHSDYSCFSEIIEDEEVATVRVEDPVRPRLHASLESQILIGGGGPLLCVS